MTIGKIRVKTLLKFLLLCSLVRDKGRLLTVREVMTTIHCSKGHAYNYLRALRRLFTNQLSL